MSVESSSAAHRSFDTRQTGRVERVCENTSCGRTFQATTRDVRRGRGRHCSRSCASATKRRNNPALQDQAGPANGNFKGWRSRDKSAYKNAFRAKYPEKALAHDAVEWAIRTGRMVKPERCQRCDLKPAEPLHSHHEDYEKVLAVLWVCRPCHRALDTARQQRLRSELEATA